MKEIQTAIISAISINERDSNSDYISDYGP